MIVRKHATRQHNLPEIAKTLSWWSISKVLKLFEQTTYIQQQGILSNKYLLNEWMMTTIDITLRC
jgi:hypothetical protein